MKNRTITPSSEIGSLGIMHLKRRWEITVLKQKGEIPQDSILMNGI